MQALGADDSSWVPACQDLSGLGRSLPFSVPVNLQIPFDPQLRKKGRLLIPLSSGKSPGRGDWQRGLIFGWLSDLWLGIWVGGYRSVAVRLMSYSSVCEDDFSRDWVQEVQVWAGGRKGT